jgi:hypothetical protein
VKKSPKIVAALYLAALIVSCSSPTSTSSGPTPPTTKNYTLTATVNGTTLFSSGATITIGAYIDASKRLVDIKGTSASLDQTIELYFVCPSSVTAPLTITAGTPGAVVVGKYFDGGVTSSTVWMSADTASATVNSFSMGPADTSISVDFSYTALGGPNGVAQTAKKISAGTLRKQ